MRKLKLDELGRQSEEDFKNSDKHPIVLILDDIRSLNNVGSAFRTSDALALEKIYLCGITGTPPHRDINKTALGAQNSVEWEHVKDIEALLTTLKNDGYTILAAEQTSESVMLDQYTPPKDSKLAVIFGNEVMGVSDKALSLTDTVLEIPQYGTKHSFNVSVSMGIMLWDLLQKGGKMQQS